jgi:hypothetical protein
MSYTFTAPYGGVVIKDPSGKYKLVLEWESWLGTDQVGASTWTVSGNGSPASLVIVKSAIETDSSVSPHVQRSTSVIISGGTLGTEYTLTNHITTISSPALEEDCSITVRMQDK